MRKRIIDSWPYVLALVIGFILMAVLWPYADGVEAKGMFILMIYIFQPIALLIGGGVLGFRRGFDWVTLLVCLVVYLVGLGVTLGFLRNPSYYFETATPAVLAFFLPATLIGTGLGTIVRALSQRSWVAVAVLLFVVLAVLVAFSWFLWTSGAITGGQ